MLNKTCLHAVHEQAGGRMVDFGGWSMPLHYGSQLDEHHIVRNSAGLFDVSHMTIVDVSGADGHANAFLKRLLANDIDKAAVPGQAIYTSMLNAGGGVIDDLIAYWLGDDRYRLVVNAATRDKDIAWLEHVGEAFDITLEERPTLAMIAVQGPLARERAVGLLPKALADDASALKPFHAVTDGSVFVARTGYTGEDGWEVILPEDDAVAFWQGAVANDISPCGLGARDTLRLEAGLNLYGADMDESTTPFESNLAWTVALDEGRDFIGADALRRAQSATSRQLVGLLLEGRGVLRDHQTVVDASGTVIGEITSGGFSPTLQRSIALARIAVGADERLEVEVRQRRLPVRVVAPPFVRRGKVMVAV